MGLDQAMSSGIAEWYYPQVYNGTFRRIVMTELDLLAGIVASDGHIYKNKLTFCIINKDLEFLEKIVIPSIKSVLGKCPEPKFVNSGFSDGKYKVVVSSVKLVKRFNEEFKIPAGAKSLSIKPPRLLNNKRKIEYMSGWIAGDGSVTHDRGRPKIEIWSNNLGILEWFKDILFECSIESRLFFERNKKRHILRIGKKDDVVVFYKKIKIPHPRKQEKLNNYIKDMAQDPYEA